MDNQEIEVRNEGSLLLWLLAVEAGGEEPLLEASGETLLNVRAQIDRPLVRLASELNEDRGTMTGGNWPSWRGWGARRARSDREDPGRPSGTLSRPRSKRERRAIVVGFVGARVLSEMHPMHL